MLALEGMCVDMLRKVENQPVMTIDELKVYYSDNWFHFVVVDENVNEDSHIVEQARVTYLADSEDEIYNIPQNDLYEPECIGYGTTWGINVNPEPGIQVGGIDIEVAWPQSVN